MPYLLAFLFFIPPVFANPYPDPDAVPKDGPIKIDPRPLKLLDTDLLKARGFDVLRVQLDWNQSTDTFSLASATVERSGTDALSKRAAKADALGSYQGILKEAATGRILFYDATGTGQEFRKLTRALTFRFPAPRFRSELIVMGENPKTGVREQIFHTILEASAVVRSDEATDLEVRLVKVATVKPALIVNVYAEGYTSDRKEQFWKDAKKLSASLENNKFPEVERMEIQAVFAPSKTKLGSAQELGMPVPERDSFLGLYYPYWDPFGRWYHIVYPTREARFRGGIGQIPYDYPVALIDNSGYWGVGNFNELTAIPAANSSFTYLLLHEFGHYFGLNEEYEGGGPTELAFAPGIDEPWSQNITFHATETTLKWKSLIDTATPIPTPASLWQGNGPFGAYKGGYADTEPLHVSHKPAMECIMRSGGSFCPICKHAIHEKVKYDLGE